MAAGESRELVSAVHSIAPPTCAEACGFHNKREQKAEQQLETSRRIKDCHTASAHQHLTRGAASQKPANESIKANAQHSQSLDRLTGSAFVRCQPHRTRMHSAQ